MFAALSPFVKRLGFFKGVVTLVKYKQKRLKTVKLPGIAHPFTLRPHTSDQPTFRQVFITEEYNIPIKEQPAYIIDGGANIGLFAIYIKNRYPDARIICIEPDPENFNLLQQNLAPYPNVHCIQYGIWDKDTRLRVYDKYDSGKWGMVVEEDMEHGTINSITISSLIKKYQLPHIDILKLDIETSEKQVFSNETLDWLQSVHMMIVELHDGMEPGCSKAFFDALSRNNQPYYYSTIGENTVIQL